MSSASSAIRRVEVFALERPIGVAVGPSVADYTSRTAVIVRIEDGAGNVGWGETYRRLGTAAIIAEAGNELIGRQPSAARVLQDRLSGLVHDRYALGALSIAIDDLRARQWGVPIADLYGGARRSSVRAYASSGGYRSDADPEDSWPDEVRRAVAEGFTACKIRIGRFAPEREIPILEKIRAEVGMGVDLMVDANGAYSIPTARAVGRALARLGFRWFEEPLIRFAAGLEYPGYEQLGTLDIAIAGGEGLDTRSAFAAFIARGAATIVQPDVAICGGIGETLFVAELAALSGRVCMPHAWGGTIQLAATLQLISLLPEPAELVGIDSPMLEIDRLENPLRAELSAQPIQQMDGRVSLPDGPGLGIVVNEEGVQALAEFSSATSSS